MALSKNDLKKISELFSELFSKHFSEYFSVHFTHAFKQVVIPYVDTKIGELRRDMNDNFASVHARIEYSIALNSKYLKDCASKKEHLTLKRRVDVLEAKV